MLVIMVFIVMWFWPSKKAGATPMPTQEQPPPLSMTAQGQSQQVQQMTAHEQMPLAAQPLKEQAPLVAAPLKEQAPLAAAPLKEQAPLVAAQLSAAQQPKAQQSVPARPKSDAENMRVSLQNILDTAASSVRGVKPDSELANLMADEPEPSMNQDQKVTVVDDPSTIVEMTGESDEDRELRNLMNQL